MTGVSATSSKPAPAQHREFGGAPGAVFVMCALPITVYALYFLCNGDYCLTLANFTEALEHIPTSFAGLWDPVAFAVVVGWVALQAFFSVALPGKVLEGLPLIDGSKLKYKMNGHLAFWVTIALLGGLHYSGAVQLSYAYHHFPQLITAAMILAVIVSICCYANSFRPGAILAKGGNTGNPLYDFFIGRELNPRVCGWAGAYAWDVKASIELRAALFGWVALNLCMMARQYEEFHTVSTAMLLEVLMEGMYVWDALFNEPAFLSTMDVTTDGFGFMLVFGNLVWVPFVYSLQARYLADHQGQSNPYILGLLAALHFLGYSIFRGANSQKDQFRRNPDACKHMRSFPTRRGTRLLISGWWGMARKINYTGDWLMSLAWCSLTGTHTPITYFYSFYFAILLVHRAMRDEYACREKYGEDWDKYKSHVKYVFFPYLI